MIEHDLTSVLVVSESHITGIVVAKIVERLGLRPTTERPTCQPQVVDRHKPFLVILDGGADGRACDAVLNDLAQRRSASGRPMPRVILLSNNNDGPVMSAAHADAVDQILAKPVTPDSLQPRILGQLAKVRIGL